MIQFDFALKFGVWVLNLKLVIALVILDYLCDTKLFLRTKLHIDEPMSIDI